MKAWQKTRLSRRVGQQARDDEDPEACLTEVMTEFRVSGRSDLDVGEAGNGRSDAPMDVVMDMATAVTSIAAETAGATIFQPMERNEKGQRRRRSKAPVGFSDWRSHMERAIRQ